MDVKRKIAPPICLHFEAKIADFGLNCCILKENPKNNKEEVNMTLSNVCTVKS